MTTFMVKRNAEVNGKTAIWAVDMASVPTKKKAVFHC